jgi:hypothetical protein
MPTRWTYEALMVSQFKDNRYNRFSDSQYGKTVYEYKKDLSIVSYHTIKLIPELYSALEHTDSLFHRQETDPDLSPVRSPRKLKSADTGKLSLLRNELTNLTKRFPSLQPFRYIDQLTPERYNHAVYENLKLYLGFIESNFNRIEARVTSSWDEFYLANRAEIRQLENRYHNLKLQEIVTKFYERDKNRILEYRDSFVQNYDPVYLDPVKSGFLAFRTHFFAPSKYFFGSKTDTFTFNITFVLLSTIALFLILYHELLGRLVNFFENLKFRK